MRIIGRLTKWVAERGWGICNSYSRTGTNAVPERFFVHINNFVNNKETGLGVGVRISFEAGSPRQVGELPAALQIELAPHSLQHLSAPPAPVTSPVKSDDANGGVQ